MGERDCPPDLTTGVLAALNRARRSLPGGGRVAGEWDMAFAAALADIGLDLPAGDNQNAQTHQEAFRR